MSQVKKATITAIFLISGLLVLGACGSSSSNPDALFDADSGHAKGWLPSGHRDAARIDQTACAECHGSDYLGGASDVSCSSCHLGGSAKKHPQDWTGSLLWGRHAAYAGDKGTSACANAYCHGADLRGAQDSGPSCVSCHIGGDASAHPRDWGNATVTSHAEYVSDNGSSACANAACHGTALNGVEGSGSSCSSCHLGGASAVHPLEWGGNVDAAHGAYVETNGNAGCANVSCHGASLTGVTDSGPSCTSCHAETGSFHPSDWGQSAVTLHGAYVDANGTTACANAACHGASLSGVTDSGPSCSSCHLGGSDAVHPAVWGDDVDTAHSAYVASNGTTACANAACHGASLTGVTDSGPSCSSCHLGGSDAVHPASWGDNIDTSHGAYVETNGNMSCANASCHGSDLSGVTDSGPSCSSCHIGSVGSFHPEDWSQSAKINHAAYARTNGTAACANASCHGATLAGVTDSGPACSTCHLVVASSSGAPQPSSGCTSCHGNPPSGSSSPDRAGSHSTHNALTNVTGVCTVCHSGAGSGTTSHGNDSVNVAMLSEYTSKTGGAASFYAATSTCSNISCHGGQRTPVWSSGTIDVNNQCGSCHAFGNDQYNSYYSGQHDFHVNGKKYQCISCHDTTALATGHFTTLNTQAMEGPASGTLKSSVGYSGSTCSTSCHPEGGPWSW